MSLTDLQIQKLKQWETRYEVPDGNGLFVRVSHTGRKTFIYRYRFGKEKIPRRMTLGTYPALTLAKARVMHTQAMQDVINGIDPGAKMHDYKTNLKAEPTFRDLLNEYWKMELSKSPSANERKRLVEKDALPCWSSRKVSAIRRRDAVVLLDDRAPITANRLQGVLVRMFNFASERGMIDFSPLSGMKRKNKEPSRARVLTNEEIKNLWNALDPQRTDIDIYRLTKLALRTILLTGQRPGEVAQMTWDQIEGSEWWNIPEEVTKTRSAQRIPINPMLAAVIEEAEELKNEESPYVFRSTRKDEAHVSVGAMANAIRRHREEMKIPERFTPHDLRRTLRTRLAELGVSDVVAERVLGHKLQGVLGIYNRHSYDTEKRQALLRWEQRLTEILGLSVVPNNVITLEVLNA